MKTFETDTALECTVSPGLGWKRGKLQKYARASFAAIIVHTTGRGILRKAKRWGVSPFLAALRVYSRQMDASGHYVVGQCGSIGQVVPEDVAAWHVGGKLSRKYNRASWWKAKAVLWWRERWPQFVAPGQLAGGHLWDPSPKTGRPSCNANTVAIEVVPPEDPKAEWSPECWAALAKLCWDISERREIPLTLETVLTHSDAHPIARSARGKPWDVAPHQWSFERFAKAAGLPLISGSGEVDAPTSAAPPRF